MTLSQQERQRRDGFASAKVVSMNFKQMFMELLKLEYYFFPCSINLTFFLKKFCDNVSCNRCSHRCVMCFIFVSVSQRHCWFGKQGWQFIKQTFSGMQMNIDISLQINSHYISMLCQIPLFLNHMCSCNSAMFNKIESGDFITVHFIQPIQKLKRS